MRWLLFILLLFIISCSNRPDNVLDNDEMIDLMIDMHKGEAYVDMNNGKFYNDSLKKTMKQSVLLKHNVTQEDFDSSLVWYGQHIDEYGKVYDEIINELQTQDKEILVQAKKEGEVTIAAGDSVNMWTKRPIRVLSIAKGDSIISFEVVADKNFKKGDRFQFAFRTHNNDVPLSVFVGLDYKDGSISYILRNEKKEGWNKLVMQSDTAKQVKRIYGIIKYQPESNATAYLDSIMLLRTRYDKDRYSIINIQKKLAETKK